MKLNRKEAMIGPFFKKREKSFKLISMSKLTGTRSRKFPVRSDHDGMTKGHRGQEGGPRLLRQVVDIDKISVGSAELLERHHVLGQSSLEEKQ